MVGSIATPSSDAEGMLVGPVAVADAGLKSYQELKESGVSWLGKVPAHWEVRHLGRIGRFFKGGGGTKEDEREDGIPCVRYGDLYTYHRFFITASLACVAPDLAATVYTPIRYGDVLFAGSGETIDEIGKSAVNLIRGPACCGGDVIIFRPSIDAEARFLGYAADCSASVHQKACIGRGFTVMHIYSTDLKYMAVAIPPVPEQAAIVRFLDHADRRIRRYIRAKQKLITLLEEQKQAIIHQAVTRGIGGWAKLKATGNTWFPDVPAHWDVMPMRRVITRSVDGPHHSPEYLDHGIPFLSARNIKVDRWSLEDVKFISQIDYETFCQRVKPARGDVLYTKGGTTGVARTVDLDYPFQVWVHVAVLKLRKARILPRYLATALNSPRCYEQSQLFTRGATNQDLGLGRMKDIVIPVPPLADQSDIIERVAAIEDQIGSGIKAALHEIELLREYRTRLIADVVTGKLDVREVSAGLPEIAPLADEFDALTTQATETGVMELEGTTESPEELAMENEVII